MQKKALDISLKAMLWISLPMLISQTSETIMLFTDRFFLSMISKNHLSAAMSGGLSSFTFSSFFIGLIGYVNALAAQYHGAGQYNNSYRAAGQSVWLSLLCYPCALLTIPFVLVFFRWAGHTATQVNLEFDYFRILMFGSVFSFIRSGIGGYFIGTGRTMIVMVSNIIGMLLNIPLNYILIFGVPGLPALGIEGAALGTLGGSLATCLFLGIVYNRELKLYRKTHTAGHVWKWDTGIMKKLLKYGIPAGGEMFIAVFLFNFFLQLMSSYNENVAAAVTITLNYDLVSYVPLMGISFAVTTLVGQQMGAGSVEGARKAVRLAVKVAFSYALFIILIFVLFPGFLVKIFSHGLTAEDHEIIPLAETMLRLAAIYILADATQLTYAGALRGAGDTRWVMFITVFLHLLMAAGAFIMIKWFQYSPIAVWIFFIFFVLCLGGSMFLRYLLGKWQRIRMIAQEDNR